MIERISLVLFLLVAGLLTVNLYVVADRFGAATESYDQLVIDIESFTYLGPDQPVEFDLIYQNGSDSEISVTAVEFSLSANGVSVGGDDARFELRLPPESDESLELTGRLIDRNVMERAEEPDGNTWLVTGRTLVQVNGDLEPIWINFGFRAES